MCVCVCCVCVCVCVCVVTVGVITHSVGVVTLGVATVVVVDDVYLQRIRLYHVTHNFKHFQSPLKAFRDSSESVHILSSREMDLSGANKCASEVNVHLHLIHLNPVTLILKHVQSPQKAFRASSESVHILSSREINLFGAKNVEVEMMFIST